MNGSTIILPKKVFKDLVKATEYFEYVQDELEDYILSRNKHFITRARKGRNEHKRGRFLSWEKVRSRYGV